MSNIIAKVTRNTVTTSDDMIGQTLKLLDGTKTKISGCPSGTSYSVEGTRNRVYAYLIVKQNRVFTQIQPEDVDGKVTDVEDAGGYAVYTFAGKRRPTTKPVEEVKPTNNRRPSNKQPVQEEEPKKPNNRRPSSKPASAPVQEEPKKPSGRRQPVKPVQEEQAPRRQPAKSPIVVAPLVNEDLIADLLASDEVSEKLAAKIRKHVLGLVTEAFAPLKDQVTIDSESKFNGPLYNLTIAMDFTDLMVEEEPELDGVTIDEMVEVLLDAKILTAKEIRGATDDYIAELYAEYVGEESGDTELDDNGDDEGDPELDDNDESGAATDEPLYHNLPKGFNSGFTQVKDDDTLDQLAAAWALDADDISVGLALVYNRKDGDVNAAYLGLMNNKDGELRVVLADAATLGDAKITKYLVPVNKACDMCAVEFQTQSEEHHDVDAEEHDDSDDFTFEL